MNVISIPTSDTIITISMDHDSIITYYHYIIILKSHIHWIMLPPWISMDQRSGKLRLRGAHLLQER